MWNIAIRNLLQEKFRLLMSIGGVTFSILLMLTMIGIYAGSIQQFTLYIEKNPTDLVVAKQGIVDFYHGISVVETTTLDKLSEESGVKDIVPMISQRATLNVDDEQYHLFVVSFFPDKPQGAPWDIIEGTLDIQKGEIIISDTLARKIDKQLGDSIELANTNFTIRGIAAGASSFSTHYAWITYEQAQGMSEFPGVANFAFITLEDPTQATKKAKELSSAYSNLSILDKSTFIENNRKELEESYLPIIQAIVVISIVIGITVVGLTMYTATIDKAREYGILKAIGVSHNQLYNIVATQSFITVILGVGGGVLASLLLAQGLAVWIDLLPIIQPSHIGAIFLAGLGMALSASLFPVRRLANIDPAEVFKA